jgi:cysteine-rich repeat protein
LLVGFDEKEGTCQEICGDGIRLSLILECDDGNNVSGDGCSQNCEVEFLYVCHGGTPISADLCTHSETFEPIIVLDSFDDQSEKQYVSLFVLFSRPIEICDTNLNDPIYYNPNFGDIYQNM